MPQVRTQASNKFGVGQLSALDQALRDILDITLLAVCCLYKNVESTKLYLKQCKLNLVK